MSLLAVLDDPKMMAHVHGWLAVVWAVLTVLTTAWALIAPEHPWLLAWVIAMSGWANTAAHWGARQGAAPSAKE